MNNIKDLIAFLKCLNELFEMFNKIVLNIVTIVNSAIEKINSLSTDEVELRQQLEDCKQKLLTAKSDGEVYNGSIRKLLQFGRLDKNEAEKVKEEFRKGELKSLNEYIRQIVRYLDQSAPHYKAFLSNFEDAKSQCTSTLTKCERKKVEAKNRKVVARVIGGGAAAAGAGAVVGGGVTASIVAGMFTFGIGTAVGLGITAIVASGAIAAGVGTAGVAGVTSHLVARQYEKARTTFQEICEDLEKLNAEVNKLKRSMSDTKNSISAISDDTDNVNANIADQVEYEQFCKVFDILLQGIREAYTKNGT